MIVLIPEEKYFSCCDYFHLFGLTIYHIQLMEASMTRFHVFATGQNNPLISPGILEMNRGGLMFSFLIDPYVYISLEVVLNNLSHCHIYCTTENLAFVNISYFYGVIIGCYALHKILSQDFSIHWLTRKVFGVLIFFQNSKDQNIK